MHSRQTLSDDCALARPCRKGRLLVAYILKLREQGEHGQAAIVKACVLRLRPVLMTALTGLLGLIPLALARGVGSEVQRPLAIVVIGGLVTSTLLTLLVLPSVFPWFEPKQQERRRADRARGSS